MITVVDYDLAWPAQFEALCDEYAAAFARASVPVIAIEHVGSTSVPGALRWAFAEPPRLAWTNTYVVVNGCLSLRNHLGFRDTLRSRPDLRDRYGALKQQVGATAADLEAYGHGKNALIREILAVAGLTAEERQRIDAAQVPTPRPRSGGRGSGRPYGGPPGRGR